MVEIDNLRSALLALHKAVLAAERGNVERIHGPLSNAEFLQVVQDPLRYGWLKPLTELILAFDDARAGSWRRRSRKRCSGGGISRCCSATRRSCSSMPPSRSICKLTLT